MEETAECINSSKPLSHALHAQLVANENGDVVVPSYDWQEKLGNFRAVTQLKNTTTLSFHVLIQVLFSVMLIPMYS